MQKIMDSFGRSFPYIRLSITDVCNFKCGYCLPNGYQKNKSDNRNVRSLELIEAKVHRLSVYYKKIGRIPKNWKYKSIIAQLE